MHTVDSDKPVVDAKEDAPTPTNDPIDYDSSYEDTTRRFPKTIEYLRTH